MPSQEKIDRTLGGRLNPAPEEMFQTDMGSAYWDRVNNFINFMDSVLPPGYRLASPSGYRPESKDSRGKKIGLGSHQRPSFDFAIVSDDPDSFWSTADKKSQWSLYQNTMQPLAQYFGMEARGTPHGTGPHIHTQSNPSKRALKTIQDDAEKLERYRKQIIASLGVGEEGRLDQYKHGGRIRDAYGRTLI